MINIMRGNSIWRSGYRPVPLGEKLLLAVFIGSRIDIQHENVSTCIYVYLMLKYISNLKNEVAVWHLYSCNSSLRQSPCERGLGMLCLKT